MAIATMYPIIRVFNFICFHCSDAGVPISLSDEMPAAGFGVLLKLPPYCPFIAR
jgi:hypothetical protein